MHLRAVMLLQDSGTPQPLGVNINRGSCLTLQGHRHLHRALFGACEKLNALADRGAWGRQSVHARRGREIAPRPQGPAQSPRSERRPLTLQRRAHVPP